MKTICRSKYAATNVFRIMDQQGQMRSWLARQLDCSPATLSKIERGQRNIPQWFVDGCVAIFRLPEEALFLTSDGLGSPDTGPEEQEAA